MVSVVVVVVVVVVVEGRGDFETAGLAVQY
jgi:hypothetical protein